MEHQHQIQKYTCPMHPHILQDAPGKCPLCGMTLEPVVQTAPGSASDEITNHSTHGGMVSDFQKRFDAEYKQGILFSPAVAAVLMTVSTIVVAIIPVC